MGESGRIHGAGWSVVDFNRGGTPLVEIVTEPDLRSAADAREFLQLLRTTLKQIGVSDVNMEEGSLRCDANVSVRKVGEEGYRTKTELKNMNSFRFLERGIEAEIARQIAIWESGRHGRPGDDPLRSRDGLADAAALEGGGARLPLLPRARPRAARADRGDAGARPATALPELPAARLERYRADYGLADDVAGDAGRLERAGQLLRGERCRRRTATPARSRRWTTGELVAFLREQGIEDPRESKLSPARARGAGRDGREPHPLPVAPRRRCWRELTAEGGEPAGDRGGEAASRRSRTRGELEAIVERAIEANAAAVEQIRSGQGAGGGRDRGRGDEGDQGPRRRRRGQPPDPGEAGHR